VINGSTSHRSVQTLLDTSADLENVRARLLKLTRGPYHPQ
jgi:hypothetical protein